MASVAPERLADLTSGVRRLALVGLAKNTGKTETLATILAELAAAGVVVGVTSIGRDGEEHDVIDARIAKPRVHLREGSLVASTGELLSASGVAHERLSQTGVRTPLGEVVLARLSEPGAVEIAGPSAAADVRAVCAEMEALGAEQVLIDGAVDRRAASSPAVADGLVVATGAVIAREIDAVVDATAQAVDVIRLPRLQPDGAASAGTDGGGSDDGAGTDGDGTDDDGASGEGDGGAGSDDVVTVARELVLSGEPAQIAALLRVHPHAHTLRVEGALGESFLDGLLAARRERAGRELRVVIGDPTRAFLTRRGPRWYAKAGVSLAVLQTIDLRAITVNPVAPMSHSFDSRELRERISSAVGDVPVVDVRALD
ncbi:MAG TPA: hypothetical protein VH115_06060 [Solirubrobacteraceae bacterium]|nr:hypothetical protein [Solirubrobacteraceae bacterium]